MSSNLASRLPSLYFLWLSLLNLAAHSSARVNADEVVVWTPAGLLLGLGNPQVLVLRLASDITLTSDASIPGASPSSGVYTLTRNVTITAPAGKTGFTDWYPTLDFTYSQ